MSKELFYLIKSLTKQEKRYFKLYASRHTIGDENISIKLFDAIAGQKDYDVKSLINLFNKKNFINHFAVTKHKLFQLILKSLTSFHINAERELDDLIHAINILQEKALFDTCQKLINKARNKATILEKWERLHEIESLEANLLLTQANLKGLIAFSEKSSIRKKVCLDNMINLNTFQSLHYNLIKASLEKPRKRKHGMDEIIKNNLFFTEKKAKSVSAQYVFYIAKSFYYFTNGDIKNNYIIQLKMIELFEKNPTLIIQRFRKYFAFLNNLGFTQLKLNHFEAAKETVSKMRTVLQRYNISPTEATIMRVFSRTCNLELDVYLTSRKFEEGLKVTQPIEMDLKKYGKKIGFVYEITILFQLFSLYFGAKYYSKALLYLNQVLDHKEIKMLPDFNSTARIANLILHFEMGKLELLEYEVRSVERYLKIEGKEDSLELILLNFIKKKAVVSMSESKKTTSFIELKSELEKAIKNKNDIPLINLFDVLFWVECKIQKQ